jgi:pimeloyl-ACP methyl ester carboxylesterase
MTPRSFATVLLRDGRTLEVLVGGAPDGPALLCHHGTPGESSPWGDWGDAAAHHGLRLLAITRPGYATSTRDAGRSVADVASDVRAVLEHFAVPWFVTVGASGGGPHALATAALVAGCRGAATLAGIGPYGVADLDFLTRMGPENIEEFGAAEAGEDALRAWMEANAGDLRTTTGNDVIAALGGLIPEVDKAVLRNGLATHIAASFRRSLAPGFDGWIDDDLAFARPWDFALDAIRVPVALWQGDLDLMVPFAHGRWFAEHIPGVQARMRAGHGHLSLDTLRDEILADLIGLVSAAC